MSAGLTIETWALRLRFGLGELVSRIPLASETQAAVVSHAVVEAARDSLVIGTS